MNNLLDTIKQTILTEEFKSIDAQIVCESLNCKLLQDLAKQLKDIKVKKQEEIDKKYKEEMESRGWSYKDSNYNHTFKEIFGNYEGVRWDKITDADIQHIPASDKKDRKVEQEILNVIKSSSKNIVLVKDKEDKKFLYAIYTWGYIYRLTEDGYGYGNGAGSAIKHQGYRKTKDLSNKEKVEMCRGLNIYFIDVSNKVEGQKLHQERSIAKSGMIMMDPDSLEKMAKDNIERYKKILRENRVNRLNNDDLINKAKKIINKVASYAAMIAKDPIRHADLIADVSSLSQWIYDKQRYNEPNRYRKQGYYSGVNGLLPMMMSYTKLVKDISSDGGYEHQSNELKNVQKEMEKAIAKADELLTKIEEKINA